VPSSESDRAALTIAGLGVLVGSMGLVIRQVDLPAVVVVWGRLAFAIPPLAVFVALRGDGSWRWRPTRKLVVSSLVLAVHWTALVAALQRAPIGTVLLITYLAPVGIAALAPRVLGERVSVRLAVALGLGVGGVALIAIPSIGGSNADGIGLAVLTGTVYVVLALLNKQLTADFGGAELALWQALLAGAVVTPLAALSDWGAPTVSWLWLPVLGVVYTAGFFGAYLTALRKVDATRAVILLYLEPGSAVIFGWLLLHEHPTAWTSFGGLAIIAGGLLVVRTPTLDPSEVIAVEPA
jgi:drug/metabolite transporter (DMT)-like permease